MSLKNPSAPYEPVFVHGESITLDTAGKVLVLPSGNSAVLPSFNEYVLSSRRLSLEDYPWGGVSDFPDFLPGTLYTATDGIYLTDIAGNNSTKTLTAGKLTELSLLAVDTDAHTITEEFIVANTGESNNPTVIDACDSADGWTAGNGTGTISVQDGHLKMEGITDVTSGWHRIYKKFSLSGLTTPFICFGIRNSATCNLSITVYSGVSEYIIFNSSVLFPIPANEIKYFVLPLNSPTGSKGCIPQTRTASYSSNAITRVTLGVSGLSAGVANTLEVYSISLDTGKSACLEIATPDNIQNTTLQCWTGSSYETVRIDSLNDTYSNISSTTANLKMLDGTSFDDVYTTGLGRAVFPKGTAEETKDGSTGSITYSANQGTKNRIGYMFSLPPSDGGRTNFNKVRLRVITAYQDINGSTVVDLSGNGNNGTIVGGVTKLNGGGLKFDGSTGYASVTLNPYDYFTAPHEIEIDVTINAITGNQFFFAFATRYFFRTELSGIVKIGVYDSTLGGVVYTTSTQTVTAGSRYTFKIVYDGAKYHIHINGIEGEYSSQPTVLPENILISGSELLIGKRSDGFFHNINLYKFSIDVDGIQKLRYIPVVDRMGSTTHQFADSTNASYGLQNITNPWIALYDPTSNEIDFYLFTHRPKNLEFKRDESGTIYEVTLYPGNGSIYWGRVHYSDLTVDSDSDDIPNCLDGSLEGSITKFLANYSMVIP